jgi:hypothetical protein
MKTAFSMKDVLSLDRLSHVIRFSMSDDHMSSEHFRYPVPAPYRDWMNPHDSVGDAARIFLAGLEFCHYREDLNRRIKEYLALCDQRKKPGAADDLPVGDDGTAIRQLQDDPGQ